jgi:hypothetical protein
MDEEWEIAFEGSAEERKLLLEAASETDGVEIIEGRNLDPLTALILVGGLALLASVVMKWLVKIRRTGEESFGQVIDLRPGVKSPIRRDKALNFGQIVTITPGEDGGAITAIVTTYDPDNDFTTVAKNIFSTLATSVGKSIESVTSAILTAAGTKASVSVEKSSNS